MHSPIIFFKKIINFPYFIAKNKIFEDISWQLKKESFPFRPLEVSLVHYYESYLSSMLNQDKLLSSSRYLYREKNDEQKDFSFYIKNNSLFLLGIYHENINFLQALINLKFPYKDLVMTNGIYKMPFLCAFIHLGCKNPLVLNFLMSLYQKEDLLLFKMTDTNGKEIETNILKELMKISYKEKVAEEIFLSVFDHLSLNDEEMSRYAFNLSGYRDEASWAIKEYYKKQNKEIKKIGHGKMGVNDLDSLIGLYEVKEKVKKIIASFSISEKKKIICDVPKFIFAGASGTGKTSVAYVIAKDLKNKGIISSDKVKYVTGASIKAKWVGHTASNINSLFDEVEKDGKMLFIDELDSLFTTQNQMSEYAGDAIGTLLHRIEELKAGSALVVAGYPRNLEEFFTVNEGLASRFNEMIYFENYSAEESLKILFSMLKKYHLYFDWQEESVSSMQRNNLIKFIEKISFSQNYANARTMRNLAHHIFKEASLRAVTGNDYQILDSDFLSFQDNGSILSEFVRRKEASREKREKFFQLKK